MAALHNRVLNLKILIVGGPEVGKTALLGRFNGEDFDPLYTPTHSHDFKVKDLVSGHQEVAAQIWDIGQTASLNKSFLRGTHAVMLVVDVTSSGSLDGQ